MPWRHEMSAWFFVVSSNFRPFLRTEKLSRSLLGRPGTFVWNQSYSNLQTFAWQTWNICMEPVICKPSNLCLEDLAHLYGTSHIQTFKPLLGIPGTFVWNQSYSNLQTFAWQTWNICMEPVIFKPSNLCLAYLEHLYGTSHIHTYSNLQTFAWQCGLQVRGGRRGGLGILLDLLLTQYQ